MGFVRRPVIGIIRPPSCWLFLENTGLQHVWPQGE